ncbi:cell division protein FtsN [Haemophilus sp. oral taxon 851]|uniref:cell division protein FtsN n=1 Tax=Haemophilus sp. oral taxon 851 TaxID=762964 RepID=UPI0002462BFD|nr:cell division protein FtsN [Haemophilus sp. oral taxon 851]EHO45826.1 cell division protein FtsN [Haemophilus sp. oral taxon 851 str. F0397]
MAHRDFAARRGLNNKKKTKKNKNILIILALVIMLAFGAGLYLLKNKNSEAVVQQAAIQQEKTQPKSVLPNRPEEVWSYIKALETRTVPVDNKPTSVEQNMRLTEEQRQVLVQMEKEQQAAEEARKLAEQQRAVETAKAQQVQAAPKVEQAKKPEAVKTETVKSEPVKKQEQPKIETAKKIEQPKTADNPNGGKKFGLQCGAFKNRAQAENMQGRLAMTGLNAQVQVNGEWNRVRVGGFASRDAAVQAQSKAKSVADCVVIGM